MDVSLVVLGLITAVILFQLYNVLGRRVGFKSDETQTPAKLEEEDAALRPLPRLEVPKFEGLKIANLDQLKLKDAQFNELTFIDKSRETYERVVLAFNRGDLSAIKDQLSPEVYVVFSKAIETRDGSQPMPRVEFVDPPKVDYDGIDLKDDLALIRMRILSELAYYAPQEEAVVSEPSSDKKPVASAATHKRNAEYWTFQKGLKSNSTHWVLSKVEAAKA